MLKYSIKTTILLILISAFLFLPAKSTAQVCTPVAPDLASWWTGDVEFFQDFSANSNGITFQGGTWTLENNQLKSTTTAGSGITAGAIVHTLPLTNPKFSALVTAQGLTSEGPQIQFVGANNQDIYVDISNGSLRLVQNGNSVIASTSFSLPLNTQLPMSLEINGSTVTGKLGTATVSAATTVTQPIKGFSFGGYFNGEAGLWDNIEIVSPTSRDLRSRNNGTLQNGATFAAGQNGQAFSFNGTSSFVQISNDSALDFGTADFSVELWFNLNTTSGEQTLFQKRVGTFPNTQEYLLESNNGSLRFLVRDTTANENNLEIAGLVSANTWNHFAAVRQGNNSKIYLNGLEVGNQTAGTNINTGIGGTAIFGKLLDFNLRFVNGRIDETGIYSRALSASEIQAIANAGTAGKCKPTATVSPSGQVAWFAGDGDARDIAGTNDGTLQNGAGFAVGRVGQGFNFDGGDDVVLIPHNANQNINGSFSAEAWIFPESLPNLAPRIFDKDDNLNSNNRWLMALANDGTNINSLNVTINGNGFVTPNNSISLNQWNHVAFTYNSASSELKLFINGVQSAAATLSGQTTNTTAPLRIGNDSTNTRQFDGLIDEASVYNRALTDAEITSIFNAGIAGKLKDNTTPTGSNVAVNTKSDAMVTFPTVSTAGTTQQIPLDKNLFPALTTGTHTGLFYDIDTSAAFTGSPTVCFNLPSFSPMQFSTLRVMHFENNNWVDVTAASNAFPTLCTTPVSSFSPFAIVAVNAPTAATVSVSGRVLTRKRGVARVRISMTDESGNVRTVTTNPFGYYRFGRVAAGETYIFSVSHKLYRFENNPVVLSVNEDLSNFNFTALR